MVERNMPIGSPEHLDELEVALSSGRAELLWWRARELSRHGLVPRSSHRPRHRLVAPVLGSARSERESDIRNQKSSEKNCATVGFEQELCISLGS